MGTKKVLQEQQGILQRLHRTSVGRIIAQLGGPLLYCKEPHKTRDKNICGEYTIEATIHKERGTRGETTPQTNNQSSRIRRREKPMEEQNRVNEENDKNIQRQETEVVTGREKVYEGAIRKMGTQEEIATKLKTVEEKGTQIRVRKRRMTKERNIKTENTFSVLQEEDT